MPEFWLHDGTTTRKARELHFHDGTAVRRAHEVWKHDGAAVRLVFSRVIPGFGGAVEYIRTGPEEAFVAFTIGADGTFSAVGAPSGGTFNDGTFDGTNLDKWFDVPTIGIGSRYFVRGTVTAGQGPSTGVGENFTADGSWHALSVDRVFYYLSGASSRAGTVLLEFAGSTTAPVLASGSYSFLAQRN